MPRGVAVVFTLISSVVAISAFRVSGRCYTGRQGLFLRALCSVMFAAIANEFLLIACEVLQAGDSETRALLWRVMTATLLTLLVFVIPAVQIVRFFIVKHPRLKLLAVPVYLVYLLLFRLASTQLPIERYHGTESHHNILKSSDTRWFTMRQDALACVSFIGITTMAFLCGISSVSAPYYAFIGDGPPVTEVDVEKLRNSLQSISEMISIKELDISRMRLDIARSKTGTGGSTGTASGNANTSSSASSGASSGSTTPKRIASSFSLTRLVAGIVKSEDSRQAQLRSLLMEHDALVSLRTEVEADLGNVLQKLEQQRFYSTFRGKIHRIVFAIFAIYCIYRVGNTYIRMCWWFFTNQPVDNPKGGPRDALVLLIAATIDQMVPDLEMGVTGWSRIIGVLMSGAVFLAALNGVLQMALRIMRRIRKNPQVSLAVDSGGMPANSATAASNLGLPLDPLVVGQVMGVYVLSIATTLRFNLPRSMSGPIMAALVAPLKVTSVQLWNDMVLGLTSTIMIPLLVATNRLSSHTIYDDEKGELY